MCRAASEAFRSSTDTPSATAISRRSAIKSIWWGSMLRHNSDYLPPAGLEAAPVHDDNALRAVDLLEIGRILRRRWHIIGAIAGVLTMIALVYVLTATTQYTATST